jgi:hypothetical protein
MESIDDKIDQIIRSPEFISTYLTSGMSEGDVRHVIKTLAIDPVAEEAKKRIAFELCQIPQRPNQRALRLREIRRLSR